MADNEGIEQENANVIKLPAGVTEDGCDLKYPKISVIIPCYNYKEYVADTVYSVIQQDYPGKVETIVVDDASVDNPIGHMERLFSSDQMPIVIRHRSNRGYSVAKNTGIRASTGEFIVLIDADDMLTPGSLKVRAEYLIQHPEVDMVRGTVYVVHGGGGFDYWLPRMYKLRKYGWRKVNAQSTMLRRRVHEKFGLYDEDLRSRSDNEMWNRLDLYGHRGEPLVKCHMIDNPPVAFYRKHKLSMIEYRRKHPDYNHTVTRRLQAAITRRIEEGITKENTPWL